MANGHGGKRQGSGQKGYRSKDKRVQIKIPAEYADSVRAYVAWLDRETYPEVRKEVPDLESFLSRLPDNLDL